MKLFHGRIAASILIVVALAAAPSAHAAANPQVSPGTLPFGNQQILTTSFAQFVSLSNSGDVPLTVLAVSLAGLNPGEFQIQTDNCTGVILFTGSNCFVSVAFAPTATGAKSAQLRFTHDGPGGVSQASLTGTGVNPAVSISPSSLNWGNQQINTTAFDMFVEVRNVGTGNGSIFVGSVTLGGTHAGQFVISNNQCNGAELVPGSNCFIQVAFSPTTTGLKNALLNIPTNDPDGPGSATLSGNGVNPAVSINPSSLPFGNVTIGSTGMTQFVEVRNVGTGNGPITVSSVTITGPNPAEFVMHNDQCSGVELPPGTNCFVQVAFEPTTLGAKSATLNVPTNDPDGPSTVPMSGTGISPMSISPTSINFGTVEVGDVAPPQTVTVTNNGTNAISVTSAVVGSSHYDIGFDTCSGAVLFPFGGQCFVQISYTPDARGVHNSMLTITTNAPGSPHIVSLTGRGIAADLSFTPLSLDFGNVEVGETSAVQTFTLTNTGDAFLSVSQLSITGANAAEFDIASEECTSDFIAPGLSCQVDLTISPAGLGSRQATLSVTSNVPGTPRTASMAGRGIDTTAPESQWTNPGAVVISLLQSVNGRSDDLVGVSALSVTFTDVLGSATTVPATLTCTNQGRNCTFSATVPLMLPGPATASINATDTSGNTSTGPVVMLLVV